jgi:3-oxoacyl-(acyl-carrier-protein) synthase
MINLYNFGAKRAYDLQAFMFIYHVCKMFKIHGFSLFINNACASGLYALEVAADIIKSSKCDVVIVSAVDHPDIYKYLWFKKINMYSPDGKIRPFSRDSNGFVFGEGGAAIILEDSEHALKRRARIYAEYLGGDFCLEGWKVAYPAIQENYYTNLLKNAIQKFNLKLSDIDLINPHGVGNKIIDSYEAKAITDIFGYDSSALSITALKPYVGHVLGGSAFLETAILLIAFEKNIIPPTLNCENTNQDLRINLLVKKKTYALNYALKICSAFGGFDAAIILKRFK